MAMDLHFILNNALIKVDFEGIELDPDAEEFASLRRLTVRIEAYAKKNKMTYIHA